VFAVIRRTHPEYRTSHSLSTPFFGVAPGVAATESVDPSPQHPAPLASGPGCFPVGSRATKARRTGLPATGRFQRHAASAAPSPEHPGDDVALCGDAGAPGKTSEISEKCAGCQPQTFAPSAVLVIASGAPWSASAERPVRKRIVRIRLAYRGVNRKSREPGTGNREPPGAGYGVPGPLGITAG
jgi:hypothetical protein